jgi:hypothetical protein
MKKNDKAAEPSVKRGSGAKKLQAPSSDDLFMRGFRKLAKLTPMAPDPDPSMPSDGGNEFFEPPMKAPRTKP